MIIRKYSLLRRFELYCLSYVMFLAMFLSKSRFSSTMKCVELLRIDKFCIAPYMQCIFLPPNMAAK